MSHVTCLRLHGVSRLYKCKLCQTVAIPDQLLSEYNFINCKWQDVEGAKGFGVFGSGVDSDCDKCYLRFYTGQVCLGLTSGVRVCDMMGWMEQRPRSSPLTVPESHSC